ncbi:MAG: YihY/virulence factor BrkB family protein [Alphaproteobacteria bacterium]|nr:YihY/virulence factor BrkB family protein [Alphaproteobacteria bacterium]
MWPTALLRSVLRLFAGAARKWYADDAPTLGAAIAFYTVFSLSPVIATILAIASALFGQEAAHGAIYGQIREIVGPAGAASLQAWIASAHESGAGRFASLAAPVVFLLGASAVFVQLQVALNQIWRTETVAPPAPPRTPSGRWRYLEYLMAYLRVRLLGFMLVVGAGFLLAVSLMANAAIVAFANAAARHVALLADFVWLAQIALSLVGLTGMFAAIFKTLPDRPIDWLDVWVGAAITAILFVLGKACIGAYLATTDLVSSYGAVGTMGVLLIWVYYSAQVFLYGAEVTWLWRDARAKTRRGAGVDCGSVPPVRHISAL